MKGDVTKRDVVAELREHGIQPSAQRVAVAEYVLHTDEHPTADRVFDTVRRTFPMISRATVYNTLHRFVSARLLVELYLAEGVVVFDPKVAPHHHFVDEASGTIYDIAWDQLKVANVESLHEFEVRNYQVVLRGRRKRRTKQ